MKTERIKLLIFDLDGTLIDSKKDIAHSVNLTFRDIGLPEKPHEVIYGYVGNGVRQLISDAVASDDPGLIGETEKSKESKEEVSGAVVQKVVGGGRSHSIFELTNALGDKDLPKAIRLLNQLLSEGAHPLYVLSMLTRQWRQFFIAREAIDAGEANSVISKKVPMPPGLFSRFLQQLQKWRSMEIRQAFDRCLSADSQLKGGSLSHRFILEALLLDLCRPSESALSSPGYSPPFYHRNKS